MLLLSMLSGAGAVVFLLVRVRGRGPWEGGMEPVSLGSRGNAQERGCMGRGWGWGRGFVYEQEVQRPGGRLGSGERTNLTEA